MKHEPFRRAIGPILANLTPGLDEGVPSGGDYGFVIRIDGESGEYFADILAGWALELSASGCTEYQGHSIEKIHPLARANTAASTAYLRVVDHFRSYQIDIGTIPIA